ncbi:Uma2 family endonuclease [Kibdelosporangium philippinense]|uniref:Uma2 family endonuclease n=1 Tax=Kibdelosporangium philippinense TaxID=211113 RepID=A0ABS8ZLD2_9PSEU|nr:Uma2 family endonuclease [Kibdelosporangium philippinense]MCE7007948.1 Uma2 family endonuclease [Kibdelosporangium philippinense]
MSSVMWPDHLLSLADWDALPEDNSRQYELAEGVLQVSPRPVHNHQWAISELLYQLRSQLPAELRVLPEFELVVFDNDPPTVRVPDLMVIPAVVGKTNPARVKGEAVLLAVEVISPGSRRIDRMTKLKEYAEAGIPDYWIVDLDAPVSITAFQLIDGDYELNAEVQDVLSVTTPAPLTVNVGDLVS